MPKKCSVPNCPSGYGQAKNVSLFKFPKDLGLQQRWIEALQLEANVSNLPEHRKLVCRKHFAERDYFQFSDRCILKPGAVPICISTDIPEVKEECCHFVDLNSVRKRRKKRRFIYGPTRRRFCVETFMSNSKEILYYTGIPNFDILLVLFNFLLKSESGSTGNVILKRNGRNKVRTAAHSLTPLNELFLTLVRLRRGLPIHILAYLFNVSDMTVSRIFSTWINLMYARLGGCNIWPSKDVLMRNVPESFKAKYPNVIGSIDCTEFNIQKPSALLRQAQCYSHYKGCNTLKGLLMIDPNGAILFVSALFTGSISDRQIVVESNFINLLKRKIERGTLDGGDIVLSDKGFNIQQMVEDVGITLNIPTFRITGMQFQPNEVQYMRKIAQERVHVERAIRRLKSFRLLQQRIPISLWGNINEIYTVCALLTNFRHPLINRAQ